jgi:micrococcal nuclease
MAHRNTVVRFSRDYRRPPRWSMGLPLRRSQSRRSLIDPRQWLKLVMLMAVGGLVALPLGADAVTAVLGPKSESGCRVVKVIDGDTVSLWCSGRGLMKTRLKGFDAPEVFSPACFSEWTSGMAATWHLRRILFSADTITVGFGGTDRYGRALASIAADGRSVSGRMIAEGYARAYDGGKRGGWCEA